MCASSMYCEAPMSSAFTIVSRTFVRAQTSGDGSDRGAVSAAPTDGAAGRGDQPLRIRIGIPVRRWWGRLSLSRSGSTSPLGKLNCELPKIRISEATDLVLRHKAAEEGLSLSEFVRIHLDAIAFGPDHVAMMAADRVRRVAANVGVNASHEGNA
jgi:hypothetical protein